MQGASNTVYLLYYDLGHPEICAFRIFMSERASERAELGGGML